MWVIENIVMLNIKHLQINQIKLTARMFYKVKQITQTK